MATTHLLVTLRLSELGALVPDPIACEPCPGHRLSFAYVLFVANCGRSDGTWAYGDLRLLNKIEFIDLPENSSRPYVLPGSSGNASPSAFFIGDPAVSLRRGACWRGISKLGCN